MSKTKNKPGIHLYKKEVLKRVTASQKRKGMKSDLVVTVEYYWHIVSKNGRVIARSSETYTRKSGAVKSIKVVAKIFILDYDINGPMYYDHSKPDSPLQSYL